MLGCAPALGHPLHFDGLISSQVARIELFHVETSLVDLCHVSPQHLHRLLERDEERIYHDYFLCAVIGQKFGHIAVSVGNVHHRSESECNHDNEHVD